MTAVVVDSSLAVKWFIEEDDSPQASRMLVSWKGTGVQPCMPSIAVFEIGNAMLQRLANRETTIDTATDDLAELARFVNIVELSLAHSRRALELAHQQRSRSIYDFAFLALAEGLGCELWTADERFWRAVQGAFPFVRWLGEVMNPAEPGTQ